MLLLNSRLCCLIVLPLAEISDLVESLWWCEESGQEDVDDLVFEVPLLEVEEEELLSSHACVLVLFAESSDDLFESWGGGKEDLMSLGLELRLL